MAKKMGKLKKKFDFNKIKQGFKKVFKGSKSIKDPNLKISLRAQLSAMVITAVIVPILILTIMNYIQGNNRIEETERDVISNQKQGITTISVAISNQISLYIDDTVSLANTLIETHKFKGLEEFEARKVLNSAISKNKQIKAIFILDNNGKLLSSTTMKKDSELNWEEQDWYNKAKEGSIAISDSYINETTKLPGVIVAVPMTDLLGEQYGVFAMNMGLDKILEIVQEVVVGRGGYGYIVDNKGIVIGHKEFKEKVLDRFDASKVEAVLNATNGTSGAGEYSGIDGIEVIGAYSNVKIGEKNWGVVIELPRKELKEATDVAKRKSKQNIFIAMGISGVLILITFIASGIISRIMTKPIIELVESAKKIAEGDLTGTVNEKSKNEIGLLEKSYNEMNKSLSSIIRRLDTVVENVRGASEELSFNSGITAEAATEISTSIDEVASVTHAQTASVDEARDVTKDITEKVEDVLENSNRILVSATESSKLATEGAGGIQRITDEMHNIKNIVNGSANQLNTLSDNTKQIGDIVTFITDISKRTNLLALNATIEAARAGEHGRGFAVVADEIRALAEQTSKATKDIVELIKSIEGDVVKVVSSMKQGIDGVEKGTKVISDTTSSFDEIMKKSVSIETEIKEFVDIIKELERGMELVNSAIAEVKEGAESTSNSSQAVLASIEEQEAAIQHINTSTQQLSSMTEELKEEISKFKI